jgi:hypothetical protein
MNSQRLAGIVLASIGCCLATPCTAAAQCCLTDLFSGCLAGCRKAPAYAVAPVAPVAAPIVAPVAAPPPPVMVPVQQTSYVPETTYRTEYKCVPVTSYKPSCEIDPCTGCTVECMQPVTQYVQQAVNVPVTQYRAVTTTKYVQMQPGYAAPAAMPAAAGPPAASPFSGVQTTPQAWGAAGADVSRNPLPGVAPPALPPAQIQPAPTYQYQPISPPAYGGQPSAAQQYAPQPYAAQQYAPQQYAGQPSGPQPYAGQTYGAQTSGGQPATPTITPQAGTSPPPQPPAAAQPQPSQPPALSPAPSLKPIPELPRSDRTGNGAAAAARGPAGAPGGVNGDRNGAGPAAERQPGNEAQGPERMPVLPGTGPGAATGAFPRLLEPTSHTTSWGPSDGGGGRVQYPTAALPAWRQSQH